MAYRDFTPPKVRRLSNQDAALAITCPVCHAYNGDPCRTTEGTVVPVHGKRVRDFEDRVRDGLRQYQEAQAA